MRAVRIRVFVRDEERGSIARDARDGVPQVGLGVFVDGAEARGGPDVERDAGAIAGRDALRGGVEHGEERVRERGVRRAGEGREGDVERDLFAGWEERGRARRGRIRDDAEDVRAASRRTGVHDDHVGWRGGARKSAGEDAGGRGEHVRADRHEEHARERGERDQERRASRGCRLPLAIVLRGSRRWRGRRHEILVHGARVRLRTLHAQTTASVAVGARESESRADGVPIDGDDGDETCATTTRAVH